MGRGGSRAASTGKAAVRTGQTAGGTSDGESRGRKRTPAPHLRGVSQGAGHSNTYPCHQGAGILQGMRGPAVQAWGWLHLALHIILASQ